MDLIEIWDVAPWPSVLRLLGSLTAPCWYFLCYATRCLDSLLMMTNIYLNHDAPRPFLYLRWFSLFVINDSYLWSSYGNTFMIMLLWDYYGKTYALVIYSLDALLYLWCAWLAVWLQNKIYSSFFTAQLAKKD